ncbi:type II secretion system protein GspL [Alteromonas aestuariivivens]|uniref:Type II secretion system protein L n=1 Tax=Alteromonas aestuariivivens TaxID=1938339 RepID=A0A3D8M561_9ALTE|nr:type II secretion system protein GspL [Alteromonas aestuariivivens]RDV24873.1 type II secretion system protein GspL [Alteromonas aestuariivivens]
MEQLLVRLGSRHADPIHWLVWSSTEQEIIASGELTDAGQLSTLSERAGQRPVIALAPTSDILLKWVQLPPRAGRKVLSAVPFMLEDELALDISQQFFAMGPRVGDRQAVAVVAHAQLTQWRDWLSDANLNCQTLLPDVLAVPQNPAGWSALKLGEQWLLREDEWKGLQGEPLWVIPALTHLARQQETPLAVVNYSETPLSEVPNLQIEQAPLELPMLVLAKEASQAGFNLFQGEYKVKHKKTGHWQQWRMAAVLAALALTTSLVDKGVSLYQLKSNNAELSNRIDETVQAGFPRIGVYRDVRRKLQSEMAKLEQGGGNASMLVMLEQLTPAFAASDVKPQTLRFDSDRTEIRIQALGRNFEALEQFRRQAESAGFVVEQGAINNRDNGVVGSVAIRSQS